jgi:hypothetical protein
MSDLKRRIQLGSVHVDVYYHAKHDGGGATYGQQFLTAVPELLGSVDSIHEVCAGPGFIGFSLLGSGLCNQLHLSDCNMDELEANVIRTVGASKLGHVSTYSDWNQAPQVDLIVGNPPHYSEDVGGDLLSNDIEWAWHAEFLGAAQHKLKPGGSVLLQESYRGSRPQDFEPLLSGLTLERTFQVVPSIDGAINPYYFMWFRKKSQLVSEEAQSVMLIEHGACTVTANVPIFLVGDVCGCTISDITGRDGFRRRPLMLRNEDVSCPFMLSPGRFTVNTLDGSKLMEITACLK